MANFEQTHTRLKTSRIAAGYKTATEFCKDNRIPLSTYNMHETGKRKLMPIVAGRYAQILQVDAGWLLTGQGAPYLSAEVQHNLLTAQEFVHYLDYQGNRKIKSPRSNSQPPIAINSELFCSIFKAVVEAVDKKAAVGFQQVVHFSADIYQDIMQTSQDPTEQYAMIGLAITLLKKNVTIQQKNDC